MDDTSDLVAGLKAEVDQRTAAAPAPQEHGDDLVSGLKADVDRQLSGAAPAAKPPALTNMPFADKVSRVESGGNPNAKAPGSSATGTGQFINSTWVPLVRQNRPDLASKSDDEILAMRNDPELSRQMIDAYGNQNAKILAGHGVPVSDATKYGAHWFGPDAYTKIHKADPQTPIESVIGDGPAALNRLSGKTTGDVTAMARERMGDDYQPAAGETSDGKSLDWLDTIEQAGENLVPSAGKALAGVASSVMHPVDTVTTLGKIAKGLRSKIDGYAGADQDPEQKAKDEQLVDALGHSYKDKYGSLDGFKKYLASDPAGVLMDASTVLGGGGSLAAKLPGVAGKAGEVAADVGKVVNPLNPAGVVTDAVKQFTGGFKALDAAGNVTPKVDAVIKKVTDGAMSGADLDPAAREAFAATIAKKGMSDATVKEAIMRSAGLKAPTQSITGVKAANAAKEATDAAIEHNNDILDAAGSGLAGAHSPHGLGEALDIAHTDSLNKASAAYDNIRRSPGTFGATMPEMPQFGAAIKRKLSDSGIPTRDMAALAASHPQAAAAVKLITKYWGQGKSLLGKDFNSGEVLAMRKELNNFRASARGGDLKAVSDITDVYDSHLQDLANRGFFSDSRGNVVRDLGPKIQAANAAYKAHFNRFDDSANSAMRAAINQLKDKQTFFNGQRLPGGDLDRYASAQDALGTQLLHPTKGGNTYNQLRAAMGGNTAPIDAFIRNKLLGDKPPKNAAALMADPNSVAARAFASSPGDLAKARHLQAARAINNTKPVANPKFGLRGMLNGMFNKGIGSFAGYETIGAPGLVVGPALESATEKIGDLTAKRAALKGAPNTSSLPTRAAKSVVKRLVSPVGLAAAHYKDVAQKENDKITRASGGRVDDDALVQRLINRWKAAKKHTDSTTKPLLDVPDAAIVRALDIAQEHI